MSLQRILELARRKGVPVVVTDIGGREAMVVMPFDEYERLSENGSAEPKMQKRRVPMEPIVTPTPEIRRELVREETNMGEVQKAAEMRDERMEALMEAISVPPASESASLSLEEQFYLEPVDSEEAK